MKKIVMIAGLVLATTTLAACNKKDEAPAAEPAAAEAAPAVEAPATEAAPADATAAPAPADAPAATPPAESAGEGDVRGGGNGTST